MKKLMPLVLAGVIGGTVTLGLNKIFPDKETVRIVETTTVPVELARFDHALEEEDVNFTNAASKTIPVVVHINATVVSSASREMEGLPDPFREFFGEDFMDRFGGPGEGGQRRQGSGSGVLITSTGYIVTNNHVIQDAEEVEVILNDQRTYTAAVIGTDPSTDIALIKINEKDLPFVRFANSDEVRIGDWVMAVGNPFRLSSTVTAGIVSAKGRNINILKGQAPIESFIQTDAAINPGNSGGALVNLKGELIGINTAIATPTGVYAGYGFAVPSRIVAKVIEDLKEYGMVQRGYLGVFVRSVDGNFAEERGLNVTEGVYIDSLMVESAALESGLRKGDVIVDIDGKAIKKSADLLETIGRHRPGDNIRVNVLRKGKSMNYDVILKHRTGALVEE